EENGRQKEDQECRGRPHGQLFPKSQSIPFSINLFCVVLVKTWSPWPMFMWSILKFVFVQTTGTSGSLSVMRPLIPIGYCAGSRVSSTRMFLSRRGLGRHEYHSLPGETNVFGMPRVTGLSVSSTISLAGIGGQIVTPRDPPPM